MNKINGFILKYLRKYAFEILFLIVTIISLKIRMNFIHLESEDYTSFLINWFNQIKEAGGIFALKFEIGNYNIPYLLIMSILSYIPVNPLISIKIVSIFFDYVMAFASMLIIYELLRDNKNKHFYAEITYSIVAVLPTAVLNSAAWAQCDSIYTTFVLLAFLYLFKEKNIKAFIFLGIAFSFKIQTIFVLPVFIIIYLSNNNFSIFDFFIIPVTNVIMCLPAIIMGRPFISCLKIYINQTNSYNDYISMNIPNIYAMFIKPIGGSNLIDNVDNSLASFGILFTLAIFAIIAVFVLYKRLKFDNKMIIKLALLSVLICTFFLPRMHDRYMYIADVISIIYFIVYRKNIIIPILINFVSLYTYIEYLYATHSIPIAYVAVLNLIALMLITKDIYMDIVNNKLCVEEKQEMN